ncbi:hypothetical protein J437_LFUL003277 [Ladona fulva]|uniref:Uncharacterized protein n=1 Tax=Ladona fulva TaxID=123851 RepID=A0A8K0NVI7_LADFU|nr:hypothetical protein J437_LFUL003277 [Ladona fulva]
MLISNVSIEVQFLQSHLADFPKTIGAVSDEKDERIPQDLNVILCGFGRKGGHPVSKEFDVMDKN